MAVSPTPRQTPSADRLNAAASGVNPCEPGLRAWCQRWPQNALGPMAVAYSAGADSTALLLAARDHWPGAVVALHVHHGLQDAADRFESVARATCKGLGIPLHCAHVNARHQAGQSPEDAARQHRYAALADLAKTASVGTVLLAQHADDQAETVLLGLGRGSGPRAIGGMRPVNGRLHRPFLALRRTETERICALHDLAWWDDPHNTDPAYRRVRVRRELLPLMEDVLGEGVAAALARTAELVRADADTLDVLALRATPESGEVEDVWAFADLDRAVRLRVWRTLAIRAGASPGELSHGHTVALDGLLAASGGTRIELPGGVAAVRRGGRIEWQRNR